MIETNLKIEHAPDLGITPAEVWHDTGTIVLNDRIWPHLPEGYQRFIIAHEEGHYYLETHNELHADKYAFEKLAGTFPYSLKTMIYTVCDILGNDPESEARKVQLRNLALEWDRKNPVSNFSSDPFPSNMQTAYVPPIGRWFYAPVEGEPIHEPSPEVTVMDPVMGIQSQDPVLDGTYQDPYSEPYSEYDREPVYYQYPAIDIRVNSGTGGKDVAFIGILFLAIVLIFKNL